MVEPNKKLWNQTFLSERQHAQCCCSTTFFFLNKYKYLDLHKFYFLKRAKTIVYDAWDSL